MTDVRRSAMALVLLLAACSPAAAPAPVTIRGGDDSRVNLTAGRYRFDWFAAGCTYLRLAWAPTSGAAETVVTDKPAGAPVVVELAGGPAYVNGMADCEYSVTISPAP